MILKFVKGCFIGSLALCMAACGSASSDLERAEAVISKQQMAQYIKILASDDFQGRKPFSPGEVKTLDYIISVYKELGLEPANGNSFLQDVPLVELTVTIDQGMKINSSKGSTELKYGSDFVAFSHQIKKQIELKNSDVVFAGYGIVAPEYGWDDYKGLNVKGKTVVVLVNDPGFGANDKSFFKGNEMTYYGRWTYKYEEAARQGASGVLIIHQTKPAGYPWSVVLNSGSVPKLYQQPQDGYKNRCAIEGWITLDIARQIFLDAGKDLDNNIKRAREKDFEGFGLDSKISLVINNTARFDKTYNILGLLRGSDLADEYIIYSAHWDHLGVGPIMEGDSIYNGAVDNGTSLAWMFEIARAFKAMPNRPRRSIIFMAPTAEESGLNGSGYYADHPIYPLAKTVANINNDLMLPYGAMKDVMITGYGQSELEDYVKEEALRQGRYILPDPNPHTGMYYRADHFSFARVGVPALFARGNNDHIEKGKDYMAKKERQWLANNYHKPFDEYQDWWDLSGVEMDAKLLFRVGWKLANEDTFPQWKKGSEFKAVREKSMSKTK